MSNKPRLVFAGTPEFAAEHLQGLLDAGFEPVAVYTQPDRPAGRGRQLQPSPVKQLALEHDIPCFQPKSLKEESAQQELASLKPDLMIVVAYGLILPEAVLNIPTYGCINVHASILPRWRGAAPIQRAIQAGDSETGITIMQMDIGLDTGDMLSKHVLLIDANETGQSLHDKLASAGREILPKILPRLLANELTPEVQDHTLANYAHKLEKHESQIDWSEPALQIDRKMRAFNPWPGSQSSLNNKIVKLKGQLHNTEGTGNPGEIVSSSTEGIIVQCGAGQILLTDLQFPGKRMTPITALRNSNASQFESGQRFE